MIFLLIGCDGDRALVPNTHDGRVPDVVNFAAMIDSSRATPSKFIIRLNWGYDTIRYPVNPNIKNWEVYRVVGTDTIFTKFQLQKFTDFPRHADSTVAVQPAGRDSVVILYRVIPVGNVIDNVQYTGKPSDIVRVVVRKK